MQIRQIANLRTGLYEFTATSGISTGQIGTHFNNVIASFTSTDVGTPGDFDGDEDVDGADCLQWQRDGGTADGLSDWQTNYGTNLNIAATTQAVPEPTALALAVSVVLCLQSCRHRAA